MRYFHLILLVLIVGASTSLADTPAPALSLRYAASSNSFLLGFASNSELTACRLELYGSASRKKLAGELAIEDRIHAVVSSGGAAKIRARELPKLRAKGRKSNSLYFLPVSVCSSGNGIGKIRRVAIKAGSGKGGLAAGNWLRNLRLRLLAASTELKRAFPNLTFDSPVDLQSPDDSSNRVFIVEQAGRIKVFENSSQAILATTFLDISSSVVFDGEQGLLGLAFHPQYASNGFFFVNYTRKGDGATVIARFKVSDADINLADPASETIILIEDQPFSNHNGGALAFGKDGYLYIALGDGGGGGDPLGHGQNTSTLLGSILRLDVNQTNVSQNYIVPADNPFVGNSSAGRAEIFAYGLRNPWRISFDSLTGLLWCADVGQGEREEVDVIINGGNYGWNITEGDKCFSDPNCQRSSFISPITDYTHEVGQSITGGYVYRGQLSPAFQGFYLYGDFVSGVLFALEATGQKVTPVLIRESSINISSFGSDSSGEVYILSYGDGVIYQLIQSP